MTSDQNKGITSITYNHLNLPKQITFANNNSITYIYNGLGVKLRKEVNEADTQATTHYQGSFQYNNNTLQYIHTAEGYVRHTPPTSGTNYGAFDYVYNYTDHLGNIRLSYTLDPSDQVLKILEENHYYPFGMKHSYNTSKKDVRVDEAFLDPNLTPSENGNRRVTMVSNTGYQIKYQGQERQEELGLGWDSFKWRNYDYAIGRFMSIDPLSEKYSYNSTYAFQENKMGLGVELEGLEMVSERSEDGKSVTITMNVRVVNNTKMDTGQNAVSDEDLRKLVDARKAFIKEAFSGPTAEGVELKFTVVEVPNATLVWEYNLQIDDPTKKPGNVWFSIAHGLADVIGNTQVNRTQVNLLTEFGFNEDYTQVNVTGTRNVSVVGGHEDGHTMGLNHPEEIKGNAEYSKAVAKDPKKNIMLNQNNGENVLPIQRSTILETIEKQQPR